MKNKVTIIAEAGVNHNGSLDIAKKLIDIATVAGADYVKFQTFTASNQVTPYAQRAEYQKVNSAGGNSQYELLKNLELTEEMHYQLLDYCNKNSIGFLSTGFDIESVNFLSKLGQKTFKVPSGEITNLPYLRNLARKSDNVILSTGISTLGEIESALDVLLSTGIKRNQVTILHCTSDYPASMNDVNLKAMTSIATSFGVAVGYSDHTNGIEIPIAAVALGATIIEKHFTVDRRMLGPDHKASIEPSELTAMIKAVRNIEIALGDGIKKPTLGELKNKTLVRKSIVARMLIKKGDIFTDENLAVKRPGGGISPMQWDQVIGKKATQDFGENEYIIL